MPFANGADVKTVQTHLGHANPSITLGWYAHAILENGRSAANMICDLFSEDSDDDRESTSPNDVDNDSKSRQR